MCWWRDAVVYQVYPRSFADSNADGVGDLAGVLSRLDHLCWLGVDALWLCPFYPSPWVDGGYDVTDHRQVHPRLGTLEDFDRLVAAAHRRGLRVLVDIVPNHTSDEHPWFREALRAGPGSPQRQRYIFRHGRGPGGRLPPNNWESRFGGPAWTRVPDGQWYLHLFASQQPDLNWHHPQVREEFREVLRFWGRRGVDGFRIDSAAALVKDPRLPDVVGGAECEGLDDFAANPDHPFLDRPEVHEIYRDWNRVFAEFSPPLMAVGETWVGKDRRAAYLREGELQQVFNFEFPRVRWHAGEYRRVIEETVGTAWSVGAAPTWMLGSHDAMRQVSLLGLPPEVNPTVWLAENGQRPPADLRTGTRRARAAALLELALPGSVYLYQGEELGLPEVTGLAEQVLTDPVHRHRGHKDKGRDGCRVPLPWTRHGPSCGFSAVAGWLPQPPGWGRYAVSVQRDDPGSTLRLYRAALRLRREFTGAGFAWSEECDRGDVVAFRRDRVLVVVNTGRVAVPLPAGEVVLASQPLGGGCLPPDAAVWLRLS